MYRETKMNKTSQNNVKLKRTDGVGIQLANSDKAKVPIYHQLHDIYQKGVKWWACKRLWISLRAAKTKRQKTKWAREKCRPPSDRQDDDCSAVVLCRMHTPNDDGPPSDRCTGPGARLNEVPSSTIRTQTAVISNWTSRALTTSPSSVSRSIPPL